MEDQSNEEIAVSIICCVYNHEKYLRKCLDGFIIQKTDFKYEILIHDDASTDGSAEIIREYELKYPEIIIPIYQIENQYSKGVKIGREFLYPRAKGKYLAFCEGDDYWCDENKLQKQFDALEKHKECKMSVHKVRDICENGENHGYFHPNFPIKEGVMDGKEFILLTEYWAFQTSSYFCANDKKFFHGEPLQFAQVTDVGDTPLMLYFGYIGNVFYYDDIMSCYRHGAEDSFNNRLKKTGKLGRIKHYQLQIKMYEEYDVYTDGRYHDFCNHGIIRYNFLCDEVNEDYKKLQDKRYRQYLSSFGWKQRLNYFMLAYLPNSLRVYRKVKCLIQKV